MDRRRSAFLASESAETRSAILPAVVTPEAATKR